MHSIILIKCDCEIAQPKIKMRDEIASVIPLDNYSNGWS